MFETVKVNILLPLQYMGVNFAKQENVRQVVIKVSLYH